MPEIKHAFNAGRMNKDLDERLVPQGEYIEANNVQIVAPEEGAIGVIRNIKGNSSFSEILIPESNCVGVAKDTATNKIYWIINGNGINVIAEFDGETVSPILVDENNVLQLTGSYIHGINVIESTYLAWTDNNSEPKIIDIALFKAASDGDFYTHTQLNGVDFVESDITVIKKSPLNAPKLAISSSAATEMGFIDNGNLSSLSIGSTFIKTIGSVLNPEQYLNKNLVAIDEDEYCRISIIIVNYSVDLELGSTITFEITNIEGVIPDTSVFYSVSLNENALFELEFIRFAYRWVFSNNQYSVISPFSETAFLPGEFNYSAKDAYNLAMLNRARRIILSEIESTENDIAYIEILAKKSNNNNIYIVDRLTKEDLESDSNIYIVDNSELSTVISSDQIIRQWDAVPSKAFTQEFISNRIIYGNYEAGIDSSNINPAFDVSVIPRTIDPGKKSIKSNTSYRFGIVFQDKYGRKTPVISNKSSVISLPFNEKKYLNAASAFKVKMNDTYVDQTNFFADKGITHFKYFIKSNDGEYYNVCAYEIFPDPRERDEQNAIGNPWIAFPSTEINKFIEGDFLLLKKRQNESVALANPLARFKVLEISASAPEFIGVNPTEYGYTSTPTNTSFKYETYDTTGKFFVKVNDINNILSDGYATSTITGENRVVNNIDFVYSNSDAGTYLGSFTEVYPIDYGFEWEIIEYYYNNGIVNYYVVQSGTGQNPPNSGISAQGTLVSSFICGGVTTTPANENETWYELENEIETNGVTEIVRVLWSTVTRGVEQLSFCSTSASGGEIYNPAIFETEPADNIIDLYYETEETFPIADYNAPKELTWFNCFSFLNGVESNRIRDDFNAPYIDNQVRVSTTINTDYKKQTNKSGLIWSGLYNSRNGVNNLNQFSTGEPITKDLSPEYGSIQRLFTRNTDLISFCEDKVIKILANKDALYNADGSTNITASNAVLGQSVAFAGEFGISKNPESLADYGYRTYFTDKERGVVLRLSMDGIEVISDDGMSSWFRDKFRSHTGAINGAYDIYTNQYIISFQHDKSVSYSEYTKGWTSFHDYTFEAGLSLNGEFYTFKNAELWKHNTADVYSNIYSDQKTASVKFVFNSEASVVKNFKTLSYEGSQGWEVDDITTDLQTGQILSFVGKEGKYFDYISGKDVLDLSNFSVQGLGVVQTNVITD